MANGGRAQYRSQLADFLKMSEAQQVGVYFLMGGFEYEADNGKTLDELKRQVVVFYSNDGNSREAMRIHVRSVDGEAKFSLTPTVYLADSDGFDAKTLRELRDAVIANKEPIERTWNDHFA